MSIFNETSIRWCDVTANPVHGCSKVSEGCKNCYAAATSQRFGHTNKPWTVEHIGENLTLKADHLQHHLSEPRWCFVNSMADLFHSEVPPSFVGDVLGWCAEMGDSAFQVLSKHGPDNDRDLPPMPRNVMLGVSCESQRRQYRLDWLREQNACTKFVSFEPLVDCIPEPDLSGIDWAIIGGESGGGAERREMDPAWARNLVRSCWRQDTAVFFKQHSGPYPEENIRLDMKDGKPPRRIEEFPELPSGIVPAPVEFLAGKVGGV